MSRQNGSEIQPSRDRDPQVGHSCADRVRIALRSRSYAEISRATGYCPETVRRYLQGATPSLGFIQAICQLYHLDAHWLICGEQRPSVSIAADELASVSSVVLIRELERRLGVNSGVVEQTAQILEVKPSQG